MQCGPKECIIFRLDSSLTYFPGFIVLYLISKNKQNIDQMHESTFSLTRSMKWGWWRHQFSPVTQVAILDPSNHHKCSLKISNKMIDLVVAFLTFNHDHFNWWIILDKLVTMATRKGPSLIYEIRNFANKYLGNVRTFQGNGSFRFGVLSHLLD